MEDVSFEQRSQAQRGQKSGVDTTTSYTRYEELEEGSLKTWRTSDKDMEMPIILIWALHAVFVYWIITLYPINL